MDVKELSNLEQEVMDILWQHKKCSIREVLEFMQQEKKSYAYTTVATLLHRLDKKGLVIKDQERDLLFYLPKISKEVYGKQIARNFLERFFDSFGDVAIASFVQSIDSLPSKKKSYLLKLLEEHDKS